MERGRKPALRDGNLISLSEFRELTKKKTRKNKYNAKKTVVGDIVLDSAGEARRFVDLKFLEQAGVITDLQRQVRMPLIVNGVHLTISDKLGRPRKLYYLADFTYFEAGNYCVEDFKGCDTALSRLKRAIVEATTGIPVRISR